MIKPYIYGGVALLIVGLFSYSTVLRTELKLADKELAEQDARIAELETENKDLIASSARKAGAAAAYLAMTEHINQLTKNAGNIIRSYKPRDTEDEKCLDRSPPSILIDGLRRENNLPRQNSQGAAIRIFTGPIYFARRTYYI